MEKIFMGRILESTTRPYMPTRRRITVLLRKHMNKDLLTLRGRSKLRLEEIAWNRSAPI
jgi:hypothetical protein